MAYLGDNDGFPLWLSQPLPEDVLSGMSLEALIRLVEAEDPETLAGEPCGFIVKGWFGPFLLSPQSSFLRGRC